MPWVTVLVIWLRALNDPKQALTTVSNTPNMQKLQAFLASYCCIMLKGGQHTILTALKHFINSHFRSSHSVDMNRTRVGSRPFHIHRRRFFFLLQFHIQSGAHFKIYKQICIVADPDPNPDPRVFGPPGSGSTSQRYGSGSCSGSGSGSFSHHAKLVRKTLIPIILWLFLTFYLWKMM